MVVYNDQSTPGVNGETELPDPAINQETGFSGRAPTVLQVLPAMGASGGVERGTVEIADAIVQAGGRAIVASSGGAKTYELTRVNGEHVTMPLHSKNPFVMAGNIGRLEQLIKDEKIDVVHARSRAPAWSAYYATKRASVPFVTTFHGTYSKNNPLKRVYNSVMVKGARVIAISNFIAGHIRRYYGIPNTVIRTIPRGVDLLRFSPNQVSAERVIKLATNWRLSDGYPVIMLPGRLTRWKGQKVVIEAIAKLGRKDVRCLLVGSDQGRAAYRLELDKLIDKHQLNEVVRIVDHCQDMPAAYMLSDVVISASTDPEAFGRVVIEAQALGRPVIATDHGGAQETVLENDTGWLVRPGDVEALSRALSKAVDLDEDARRALSEKAIRHVQDHFSTAKMCASTLSVYNEVLDLGS